MIVFSDLHLQDDSEDVVFGEVLPGIFDAALRDADKTVAFLGDWFHIRYKVSVKLFNRGRDTLLAWTRAGIKVILLPGNHDQIDFEGRNALEAYGDIDGVSVYNTPTWDRWGLWVPYRKTLEGVKQALLTEAPVNAVPVLWIHHGITGALMNDHHRSSEGLDVEDLRRHLREFLPDIVDIHHVHVWSLTNERPLLTLHARIDGDADHDDALRKINAVLAERYGIDHTTVQIEKGDCADVA